MMLIVVAMLVEGITESIKRIVVDLHLVRNGNTIYFQCTSKIKNGWGNLGITLPSEARPVIITPLSAAFGVESDPAKFGHATVLRSGAVNTLSLSEMTTTVLLSGTWIV